MNDMLAFPMPNDKIGNQTVVASVWYNDEIATVILVGPEPPFFSVAHYYMADVPAAPEYDAPARGQGDVFVLGVEENIVHVVRLYEQYGGDV